MPGKEHVLFVGIDWADEEHAVGWISSDGQQGQESFQQEPQAIAEWVASLHARFPNQQVRIALEQSRGALIAGLAGFAQLELYPINPKQLACYRKAVYPSGGKNDVDDAALLAQFLRHHQQQLRVWQPDDAQTRQIAELAELRRTLVEERKRLVSQLTSSLKLYFPLALTLSQRALHQELMLELLERWPALEQLQRAHPKTLRTFLSKHRVKNQDRQSKFINTVRAATPLTKDQAIIQPRSMYVQTLVRQIRELNKAIGQFDEQLQHLVPSHPDQHLFRSLPGAGDALVPRLIAAFGSDRGRYQSAQQMQNYSGIAPITKQSGKSLYVHKRIACPKFLRQTFHEFANHARKWSPWSRAFYNMKRAAGMKHNAAVRALAYKWIRIIYRLWKTRTTYCEATYLEQLQRKNAPLLNFLKTETST
jgi:transposase